MDKRSTERGKRKEDHDDRSSATEAFDKKKAIGHRVDASKLDTEAEAIAQDTSTISSTPYADVNGVNGNIAISQVETKKTSDAETVRTPENLTLQAQITALLIQQRPNLSADAVNGLVKQFLTSATTISSPDPVAPYTGSNPPDDVSSPTAIDSGVRGVNLRSDVIKATDLGMTSNVSINSNGVILNQVRLASGSVTVSALPAWHKAITIVSKPDLNTLLNLAEISEDGHIPFMIIKSNVVEGINPISYVGAEKKMRYLLDRAGVLMCQPITLMTYEISENLISKCLVFNSLGEFRCGMPIAQQSVISDQIKLDIGKLTNVPRTEVELNGGQLITGILLFALDAVNEYRKIILDKSVTLMFDTSVIGIPITFKDTVVLSKAMTHPFFSIASPQVKGSTRQAILDGGELYGPMPIGRESVLETVRGSPSKELHYNVIDNLAATLYAMSFSNANQNSVNIDDIITGMKACDFFSGTFKHESLADTKPPMGYERIEQADRVGFLLNLSYNTDTIKDSFLRLYKVISEMNLFVEVINKTTNLSSCLVSMQQTSSNVAAFMDRNAKRGGLSALLHAVTFLYAPECFWLELDVPSPNNCQQAILTLYGIMTFLLFFPKCAKYSIHSIHNGLYGVCQQMGLSMDSFRWISNRDGTFYARTTESNLNLWVKYGLRSEFFNPNMERYRGAPILKMICQTLSSIQVTHAKIEDVRAQRAGFPRLRRVGGGLSNGGLIPPWPEAPQFRGQSSLSIGHAKIKECILKLANQFSLKSSEITAIRDAVTALSRDMERSIMALTFIPPRLLRYIADLPVSVFYQWDGKFYTPLPSLPVLYDATTPETYQTMFITTPEQTPYDVFLAWHLTQNISIVCESDDQPSANDTLLTVQPIDPIALYYDQITFVRQASPLIAICGALSWLLDMVASDAPDTPSPFAEMFSRFGYYLKSGVSSGVYQSFLNQLTTILRRRTVFNNENTRNLYDTFFSVKTDNTLLKIKKPRIGKLFAGSVTSFEFDVIDVTYSSYFDPVYKNQVELIMNMFIDSNSLVCRCAAGLYICNNTWDNLDFRSYYTPDGLELVPTEDMVAYETRSGMSNFRELGFVHEGRIVVKPFDFPKLVFKIEPGMHFSRNLLTVLSNGFQAKKFSFLLSKINFIWELSPMLIETLPYDLTTLLSYDRNQLYQIRFCDYTQLMYYNLTTATIEPRSYVPIKPIFNYIIGSGFDAEGQRTDSIPLKTSSMQSGFKIDTYFTGYIDYTTDPPTQRRKPPISESMFNLVPTVTGKVTYSLTDQIKYTARENLVRDWRSEE